MCGRSVIGLGAWERNHDEVAHKHAYERASCPNALCLVCACMQLELANMYKQGDLERLWGVASQTHMTFNLVSSRRAVHLMCASSTVVRRGEACLFGVREV